MKKYDFLVSYILDNQPQSTTVQADSQSLTPDQALFYLRSLHSRATAGAITDVQVARIDVDKLQDAPAHHLQP
ncbi:MULTISPECIES: hypothetical protein [unclassified Pseudomonas]|uniref:hypothetical protein n=1 Tax=unclassified Pseudomonas TaxID=196821 RepID=UPI00244CB8A3|nr:MULTISPECIES: hypothetical protein [unclassified Pseudomonas]MDG9927540.1 hypothetical protein [Pseudomonas sp. GD04042]MDH0484469.1 hypothetical protein [Pseudomonas sp. GD04015]MDH0602961.1 hypothetical protein [Pseudomonas sp. GD03869]